MRIQLTMNPTVEYGVYVKAGTFSKYIVSGYGETTNIGPVQAARYYACYLLACVLGRIVNVH